MLSLSGTRILFPDVIVRFYGPNLRLFRYNQSSEGQEGSTRVGLEYALKARQEIDTDNPSIDSLQTLLLLSMVFFAYGLGKKTYMTLCMISSIPIPLLACAFELISHYFIY